MYSVHKMFLNLQQRMFKIAKKSTIILKFSRELGETPNPPKKGYQQYA